MKIHLYLFITIFIIAGCKAQQITETKDPCLSKCDAAGDELKNTTEIHDILNDGNKMEVMHADSNIYHFPLRIGFIQTSEGDPNTTLKSITNTIDILNDGFEKAGIRFSIASIDTIISPLNISLLQENFYEAYDQFSATHDLKDTISLYLFDYDPNLCRTEGNAISCGRTGGFSYILSERSNNVVLSKFDLEDHKIIIHEFGHFFGLYHTFEEHQFGREAISRDNCATTGDRICDTPADPGTLYEVYVNYSTCRMIGNKDAESGNFYSPLINNYMSYYKPCYLQQYEFTPMQLEVIRVAAMSDLRKRFAL